MRARDGGEAEERREKERKEEGGGKKWLFLDLKKAGNFLNCKLINFRYFCLSDVPMEYSPSR